VAVALLVGLVITVISTDLGLRWRVNPWGGQEMGTPGGRDTLWRSAGPIFRDFPLTGIGFGAFSTVFPRYAPPGFYRWARDVHNDFYEVLLEGGLVAAVLVLWLTWVYAARLMRQLRSSSEISPQRLGLVLGLLALGLHAAVDFNHQIPANALLFVVFAAMAVPLGQPGGETDDKRVFRQRKVLLPLIAVLLVVYSGRAMYGMVGGVAYARGRVLAQAGWYWKAIPFIDIADVGANRLRALRYGAETRLAFWDYLRDRPDSSVSQPELLVRSSGDFARCLCLAPADVRPLDGLARVYHRMELLQRADAPGTDAATAGWDSVGPHGRVAIGLLHQSVALAPGWWNPYDQLALMQWEYGMQAEALDAATQSGRVLPRYHSHAYRRAGAPDSIVDAFARGARESVERVSLLGGPQYRIPLGAVELNRGRFESAIEVLHPLLEGGADASFRAQALLLMGRAALALAEHERARTYLEGAASHPDFASEARLQLARVAREEGQDETAFGILSELRWGEPSLPMLLEYAAVARDLQRWDKAVAALRSAVFVFPEDPRPQRELVSTLAEQGNMNLAREECEKLRTLTENDAATERLCQAIEAVGDGGADSTTD
jgi:tetratricopeptide (TPR) repeat protein